MRNLQNSKIVFSMIHDSFFFMCGLILGEGGSYGCRQRTVHYVMKLVHVSDDFSLFNVSNFVDVATMREQAASFWWRHLIL